MSTPLVGCEAIVNAGSSDSSLATTTFCWLPPDKEPARIVTPGDLMSKVSLYSLLCLKIFFILTIPPLERGYLKYDVPIKFSQIANLTFNPVFDLSSGM